MSELFGADPHAAPGPQGNQGASGQGDLVKDATIETFQADVMDVSMQVPVVVDFWAAWCGPCKTLGPLLEAQVKARGGKIKMVKVDTDKNQMLAQQLRIQSLPTVMAFVGGQPVDGFAGALPESQIGQFLDKVITMGEQAGLAPATGADPKALVEAGDAAFAAEDLSTAMQAYGAAVESATAGSDEQVTGLAGMARCAIAVGNPDQAEQMLAMVPAAKEGHPAVAQVKAMLALSGGSADQGALAPLQADVAARPDDPAAHFALAEALIDAGDMPSAMAGLLEAIRVDKDWNEGAARAKLLTLFEALGPTDDAVKAARRQLSSLLFS